MQKKLIALAIASAFSAPAFADNANITFYGQANVSYDMVNTGTAASGTKGTSKAVVSSNVSRFGFKGAEELGDGLAAIWQIEQQINIDDSSNSIAACTALPCAKASANNGILATRNTFAGLKGDFGTVLLGRHDTPYKISTRKLDVFGDNIADNRSLMGNKSAAGFELRPTDVLAYISPAFGGVTAAIATVNLSEANTLDTQKTDGALSFAVMYDAAPFYGSVAYEKHTLEATTGVSSGEEKASRLGLGFSQDMFSLGLVYEKITDNLGTAGDAKYEHNAMYLSGKVILGSGVVKLGYTKLGEVASVADTGATQVSVGYDYNLSKRSKVYALYTKISNGDAASYKFSQNSGASSTLVGAGASPSAFSLGLNHSF